MYALVMLECLMDCQIWHLTSTTTERIGLRYWRKVWSCCLPGPSCFTYRPPLLFVEIGEGLFFHYGCVAIGFLAAQDLFVALSYSYEEKQKIRPLTSPTSFLLIQDRDLPSDRSFCWFRNSSRVGRSHSGCWILGKSVILGELPGAGDCSRSVFWQNSFMTISILTAVPYVWMHSLTQGFQNNTNISIRWTFHDLWPIYSFWKEVDRWWDL